AREHDLAGPQSLHFPGPRHGFQAGADAPAVDVHFPELAPVPLHALRIDIDHNALAAEAASRLAHELRVARRCGIDGDLVAAGIEQLPNIVARADSAAHR